MYSVVSSVEKEVSFQNLDIIYSFLETNFRPLKFICIILCIIPVVLRHKPEEDLNEEDAAKSVKLQCAVSQ